MALVPKDDVQFESFWTRRAGWIAMLIGFFAFVLGITQDVFLNREGFSNWTLIALSNMITGAIAGSFFYQFARNVKSRHELMRERMKTIAELNHHIRNALQVIKFWGAQHQNCSLDPMQLQHMKESVDRIEWALREVLPQYPEPAGSAKKLGMMEEEPGEGNVAGGTQRGDGKEIKLQ